MGRSLDEEIIAWLMDAENPSARYLTMTELLGKADTDGEVIEAGETIMSTGPVPRILEKQMPEGHWGGIDRFYQEKYKGTVWNLILLAELRADPGDERVRKACEYILQASQHRDSGAFSCRGDLEKGGTSNGILPCLTANMVYALSRLGYMNDERVKKGISWISRYQRFEAQAPPGKEWPYRYDRCWRPRDCRSGAVKAVKALALVSSEERSNEIASSLHKGCEFILERCLWGDGNGLESTARKDWFQFGYPHMWGTDLLEIINVLLQANIRDDRMDEAIRFIASKRNEKGKWLQEGRFSNRLITRLEKKGSESRFITIEAIKAIMKYDMS